MINKIKTFIAVAALSGTVSANVQAQTITVNKGDTLWGISQVHNVSVEKLQEWNNLSTNLIQPGEQLTIGTEKHYTVQQGDTLWGIAKAHHVSVDQLQEWNQLITDLIYPGLNLTIFDDLNRTKQTATENQAASNPSTQAKEQTSQTTEAVQKPGEQAKETNTTPAVKAASTTNTSTKEITVKATAYTASCDGCSGITATGINIKANPNEKVIAVDPSVIPLGSKVYVEGVGEATAADTGGAIKGNRIDVFIPSEQDAMKFGVKHLKVKILN